MNNTSWFRQHWVFLTVLLACLSARIVFSAGQGFSNDELSALVRTRIYGWDDFWFYGVTSGDMHPVFYQALLWFWVRFFGEGEFMVRLPGVLLFVCAHWMMYNTLRKHVHPYAGISYTLVTGTLGFFIMHSTFARPYNSGVFFLLLICSLYIGIKKTSTLSWRGVLLLGIGTCGAMLSHYFAGLVAFLFIGFTFLMVNNTLKKKVFMAGVIGVIGFLPHLNATLLQLGKGGLQWLAPPRYLWLPETLWLVLNESWIVVALVLIFLAVIAVQFGLKSRKEGFYELVLFFMVVVLFGYLISWYYTPVLRDLVVVYLLPFLLIGLLGSISFEKSNYLPAAFIGLAAVLLFHSFFSYRLMGSHHFGVFKEIGHQINGAVKERGAPNITFASNYNNIDYINYYLNAPLKEPIIDWDDSKVVKRLSERICSSKTTYFCYSFNNAYDHPIYMEMVRIQYPYIDRSYFTQGSHLVLFSKLNTSLLAKDKTLFSERRKIQSNKEEFMMDVKIPVRLLLKQQAINAYYRFACQGDAENVGPVYLVATVEQNGKQVLKSGKPLFYVAYEQTELVKKEGFFYTAFNLPQGVDPNGTLHLYVWNPKRLNLRAGSWSLKQVTLPMSR